MKRAAKSSSAAILQGIIFAHVVKSLVAAMFYADYIHALLNAVLFRALLNDALKI